MNILKAGKSISKLFWQSEEDDTLESVSTETKEAPVAASDPALSNITGKEDADIKATLIDAINKANKPGYDYLEFATAIEEQAKYIPAEETRFQATYAVAKSMGITQASLTKDIEDYLGILKQEESKFQASMDDLTKGNVTQKEIELGGIDSRTAEKAEQIKKLTEEINQIQKEKVQISNDLTKSRIKIEQMKTNFAATYKAITDRILGDLEKIKKYIPA